jgi:hypothetical protein
MVHTTSVSLPFLFPCLEAAGYNGKRARAVEKTKLLPPRKGFLESR